MKQRRALVFLILALVALVSGLSTGSRTWFALAYLLGLLIIVSFAWAWVNVRRVRLGRQTRSRRAQVGQHMEERFRVQNTSFVPKLWLEIRDNSTLPGHRPSRVVSGLRPNATYNWRAATLCRQRGRYQLGPVELLSSDPFGLFPMRRRFEQTANVVVYPQTVPVHAFTLPTGVLSGGDALRLRAYNVTTNAAGVRDYRPGDSYGRIHWRSTARRDRLIVKEFELDPLADIWIVPDLNGAVHYRREAPVESEAETWFRRDVPDATALLPADTEEYMITVAASLAQYFLRLDRAVGMLAYGQTNEIVQPDRGERQLNRLLETLAVVRAAGTVPMPDMIYTEVGVLQRGTTVITVSPMVDTRWALLGRDLMRRGMRVVSVVIDPASFGAAESAEPLHQLLQANGVVTQLVRYGDDLTERLSGTRTIAAPRRYR